MVVSTLYIHWLTLGFYGLALVLSLGRTFFPLKESWAGFFALMGFLFQAGLLLVRWTSVGYLPVTGLFSTLSFLALWMVSIALYFLWRYDAKGLLPGVLVMALVALFSAGQGDMALKPLVPALDTPLFFLHVASSFAAYGLFGVAALLGFYHFLGFKGSDFGHERRMLDEALYIGYIFFSWCMIAGSLWAYLAWGSYWTWRIKGLWSTIIWFYYSGVIHVRGRGRWQGWPLSLLVIVGFGLVLFTYLGLGLLFETSHPLR
jgi:ABC-type transport system involved in cytochrome c biogenesis permease subunit